MRRFFVVSADEPRGGFHGSYGTMDNMDDGTCLPWLSAPKYWLPAVCYCLSAYLILTSLNMCVLSLTRNGLPLAVVTFFRVTLVVFTKGYFSM